MPTLSSTLKDQNAPNSLMAQGDSPFLCCFKTKAEIPSVD